MARTVVIIVLAALLAPSGFADATEPELTVLKAKVRFGDPGDSIKVMGKFAPGVDLSPGTGVQFHAGPVEILSATTGDSRPKFVFKRKRSRERPDSVKLVIDAAKGRFSVKGRGLDLDALHSAGAEDVEFRLTIGGTVFSDTITLGDGARSWKFRFVPDSTVPGSRGWPGGGSGGTGDPGNIPTGFRILGYGSSQFPGTYVIRNDEDYEAAWDSRGAFASVHEIPPVLPPPVNFDVDMVIIIDIGPRPSGGTTIEITAVREHVTGMVIEWYEGTAAPNCAVPTAPSPSSLIAAVPKKAGFITFEGSFRTLTCR